MFMLLIVKNVLEQLRDIKRNSLFVILPMAIFVCFYGYFQLNEVEVSFIKPIDVGVVVEDETIFSKMLVDDFSSKKELSQFFRLVEGDKAELEERFSSKELDALIVIPENFVQALMYFDYLPMSIKINNEDPIKTMILYNGFVGYERYITSVEKGVTSFYNVFRDQVDRESYYEYNDALSVELIMTVLSRSDMYEFNPIVDIPSVVSVKYYFISITVMFIFLLSLFSGLSLLKEMSSQAFERLLITRVSLTAYISSKIVSYGMLMLVVVFVWTFLYDLITKEGFLFNNFSKVVFIILIVFASVVTSLLLTFFISKEQELLLFSSVFVFFNAIVGGSIIPIHYMPEGLKTIATFTPNYYVIRILLFLERGLTYNGLVVIECLLFIYMISGGAILVNGYKRKLRGRCNG